MEAISKFVAPELLVLVAVLYFLGMGLKKTEKVSDKHIPIILGGAGIALAVVWVVSVKPMAGYQDVLAAIFTAVVQGILCAGLSVYVNQVVKQSNKED